MMSWKTPVGLWLIRILVAPQQAYCQSPNGTIRFEEALQLQAAVAAEMMLSNFTDPIPLPVNLTDPQMTSESVKEDAGILSGNVTILEEVAIDPGFNDFRQLAALMPSVPQSLAEVDPQTVLAQIRADIPANNESMTRRQSGLRVMAVGDSMTHCNEGDYTWRYRLWEWFNSEGIPMTFVGPYIGTAAPPAPGPPQPPPLYDSPPPANADSNTAGGYAQATNGGWSSNHFAISGRAAAVVRGLIQQVTAQYPADIMLVMLGFNDLGWFYSDHNGLINNMQSLIDNARRSNPNMKFVIGTVPQRTYIGGRADLVRNTDLYNDMLKDRVSSWSTASSPVTFAPIREEFGCGPNTGEDCSAAYDGLHPNERGEYQIALAFSRGLIYGLGVGRTPLSVPGSIQPRPLPLPGNFRLFESAQGLTATWDKVYGAYDYDVQYIINGGAPFNFSPGKVRTNRWDTRWSGDGWRYEVRIRASASNNEDRKGPWTGWLSGIARPQTAGPATNVNIRAEPGSSSVTFTWDPPTGPFTDSITLYNIIFWDLDAPCSFLNGAAFRASGQATIRNLVQGHRYFIAIEAWNAAGGGFPIVTRSVVPGHGTPGVPTGLFLRTVDPTTEQLTWDAVSGAGGYSLWRRNVNVEGSQLEKLDGGVDLPCAVTSFNFPGTWNYEWAVSAYNGAAESERSAARQAAPEGEPFTGGTCPGRVTCPVGNDSPPQPAPVDNSNPPPSGGGGSLPPGPGEPDGLVGYAALGDSYAAGVTYAVRGLTNFDGNEDGCMRLNHAYSPQIRDLTRDDYYFDFVACSGSQLINIARADNAQLKQIRPGARIITIQSGGNNAGFANVATNCIFQPGRGTYDCPGALERAEAYIENRLSIDVDNTLTDVISITADRIRDAEKIYILGYAHFFNEDTQFCNSVSLAVRYLNDGAKLTQTLRIRMNQLVERFNRRLEQAVRDFALASGDARFTYVETTEAFNGHRFCEADQMDKNTFYNYDDKIWFWGVTMAGIFTGAGLENEQSRADNLFLDAYVRGEGPPRDQALEFFDWSDLLQLEKGLSAGNNGQWYSGQVGSPKQGVNSGALLRPFHPTRSGHSSIATLLLRRIEQDLGSQRAAMLRREWGMEELKAGIEHSQARAIGT